MFAELADFFGGLTWRRASSALILLLVAGLLLSFYEEVTHTVELDRAQKALTLAHDAERYRQQLGPIVNEQQQEIYEASVAAAHSAAVTAGPDIAIQTSYLKFLAGFLPWLLMAFAFVGSKDEGRLVGMFGALIIGLPVAAGLTYVPAFLWPWGNLALLPIVPFALLMVFFYFMSERKAKRGT